MLVAIRVDSSSQMGSGHLMRCLTLADHLKNKGHEVHFISRELDGAICYVAEAKGYNVHKLSRPISSDTLSGYLLWLGVTQEQDAQETINIIKTVGKVNILIVDNYAIGKIWERNLRPYADKIFVIDDLANRKHDCDFLLDQTYGIENTGKYGGLVPLNCIQFLGTAYSLLKPEYRKLRQEINLIRKDVHNVLVFFGGSDDTGETVKLLIAIKNGNYAQYHFIVIVGGSNPQKDNVKSYCASLVNAEFHCQVDDMEHYISISDIAFASAGVNTWERCVLGLPSIITVTADNQREIAKKMHEKNAAVILGSYGKITSEDYDKALKGMDSLDIVSLSKNAAALMDNDGIDELVKVIGESI